MTRIPRPGPTASRREGRVLRGPLEPLFDARPGDDVLAVAEAEGRLQRSLLVPQVVEALAQRLELGGDLRIVTPGELVPELCPPLAQSFDVFVDLGEGHVRSNDVSTSFIPEYVFRLIRTPYCV